MENKKYSSCGCRWEEKVLRGMVTFRKLKSSYNKAAAGKKKLTRRKEKKTHWKMWTLNNTHQTKNSW